jgi:tripartite-type tricarboxylate transporter receptor subunit TctC
MKLWKVLIGVMALALIAAACGSDPTATPRPTAAPTDAPVPPTATAVPPTLAPGETPQPTATARPVPTARPTATSAPTQPPPETDFFKGKTIRVVVGSVPGGGYDFFSRIVAKHMPQYIPGKPSMIIQNMPGAGGTIGNNFLYNSAKPDGLTISPIHMELMSKFLVDAPGIQFDLAKFEYLGHIQQSKPNCVLTTEAEGNITSFEDLVGGPEIPMGAFASTTFFVDLLNQAFGTNLKNVSGYSGTGTLFVAVEQGEVHGFCGYPASSIVGARSEWLSSGYANPFILFSLAGPDEIIPDTPLFSEFAHLTTPAYMEVFSALTIPYAVFRPFAAAPGTPEDRVLVLRDAFWKTMNDPNFIADATRVGRPVNPLPYDQFRAALTAGMQVSDEALAIIRSLYE